MRPLDNRQKIGQRLFAGFLGTGMNEDFVRLVKEHKVGNVILFKENIADKLQLQKLCADIQDLLLWETGYPAFIAIDQEGGPVSRLPADAAVIPGAMAISATGNTQNAYEAGLITGLELAALGVNFNLSPVMDINSNPHNPVIGVRSYGDTKDTVIAFGLSMIRGLTDAGILCAAKHFPGHGDTAVDSHVGLPCVDKSLQELSSCELKSFEAAIDAGVPAIMTSHILFPKLEGEKIPATMSRRIITGLLKEKLGFSGLVLSDCMMMNAIAGHYGTVAGSLMAARAGVDLLFISHSVKLAGETAQAMLDALEEGQLDAEEMEASVEKILQYKRKLSSIKSPPIETVGCSAHREAVARMMKEAVTEVNVPPSGRPALGDSPIFLGCMPFRPNNASNPEDSRWNFPVYMAKELGGEYRITSADPDALEIDDLLREVRGHTCLVLGTQNGHIRHGQLALAQALVQTGIPVICVALRNPYDLAKLPGNVYTLAAYGYDSLSLAAVAAVLSGREKALGHLPVKL